MIQVVERRARIGVFIPEPNDDGLRPFVNSLHFLDLSIAFRYIVLVYSPVICRV